MKNIEIYELVSELIEKEFRVPDRVKDKMWHEVDYDSYGLVLSECHKYQDRKTKVECFKLKYNKRNKVWSVYWMRANYKWYKLHEEEEISDMIEYVKKDEQGCFFG